MPRAEIVGIQYLRGYSAIGVALYHAAAMATLPKYYGVSLLGGRLEPGDLGVNLFFLISGFIIAAISLDADLRPRVSVRDFFSRRFLRIVPLMWIAIVGYAALRLTRDVWHPTEYLRAMTLWPWGDLEPGHIWTLRQELVFYAVFAVSMLASARNRPLLALWVAVPALLWLIGVNQEPGIADPLWLVFSPHNFEFAAGFVVAVLWLKRTSGLKVRPAVDPVYLLLGATALLFYVIIPATGMEMGLGIAIMFAPLLFLAVHIEHHPGIAHRAADLFGNASYSIYLFHPPIVAAGLGIAASIGMPLWLSVPAVAGAAVAGGVALHLVLEKPLVRLLHNWHPVKRPVAAGV